MYVGPGTRSYRASDVSDPSDLMGISFKHARYRRNKAAERSSGESIVLRRGCYASCAERWAQTAWCGYLQDCMEAGAPLREGGKRYVVIRT